MIQKESILLLVKNNCGNSDGTYRYLIPYKEFLDINNTFTDFHCERRDGKAQYASLVERLVSKDENSQIFVEVYGVEEEDDDIWIYADTIIIFSKLYYEEIKELFSISNDVFPSEIGEIKDFSETYIIIKQGVQYVANEFFDKNLNGYYCWWD